MTPLPEIVVGRTTNTAKVVTNEGRMGINLLLETSVTDEDRLQVMLYNVLRQASHAIVDVECMTDAKIAEQLSSINAIKQRLEVVPE